jgi:hypothetical protein
MVTLEDLPLEILGMICQEAANDDLETAINNVMVSMYSEDLEDDAVDPEDDVVDPEDDAVDPEEALQVSYKSMLLSPLFS